MTKYGTPPIFSPENFFTKMTQNGLKWILNTTFGNVTFCRRDPPPIVTFVTIFFKYLFEGFPNDSLRFYDSNEIFIKPRETNFIIFMCLGNLKELGLGAVKTCPDILYLIKVVRYKM